MRDPLSLIALQAFSKYGCKNEGFVAAMVTKGAELHRIDFKLGPNGITFWTSEAWHTFIHF